MTTPLQLDYARPAPRPSRTSARWKDPALLGAMATILLITWVANRSTCHLPSNQAMATSALSQISSALDQIRRDTGSYPTESQGLNALLTAPPGVPNWHGPYITRPAIDPWGHPYTYRTLTNTTFDLRSPGPDGQPNTPDDIVAPTKSD